MMTSDLKSVCMVLEGAAVAHQASARAAGMGGWPRVARAAGGCPRKSRAPLSFGVGVRTVLAASRFDLNSRGRAADRHLDLCLHITLSDLEVGEMFAGGPGVGGVAA